MRERAPVRGEHRPGASAPIESRLRVSLAVSILCISKYTDDWSHRVIDEQARADIAFIRRAIEEGSAYATACSPDMLVWGIAVALSYLSTYGLIPSWHQIAHNASRAEIIGTAWL